MDTPLTEEILPLAKIIRFKIDALTNEALDGGSETWLISSRFFSLSSVCIIRNMSMVISLNLTCKRKKRSVDKSTELIVVHRYFFFKFPDLFGRVSYEYDFLQREVHHSGFFHRRRGQQRQPTKTQKRYKSLVVKSMRACVRACVHTNETRTTRVNVVPPAHRPAGQWNRREIINYLGFNDVLHSSFYALISYDCFKSA